jgi:glycerol-3-phosphate acyltransferase PlsY
VRALAGLLAAYLIGAVPVGFLVARAFGIGDIRQHGSGNVGMTNVLRTAGWLPGLLTLGGDVIKGYLAVAAGAALGGTPVVAAAAAVAAVSSG